MQVAAVLALYVATFSRLLEQVLGLPRWVNWLHFPLVGAAFLLSLGRIERGAAPLFVLPAVLFGVFALSGWINDAGLVNVAFGYVLLAEPFLLFAVLVNAGPVRAGSRDAGLWLPFLGVAQIPLALPQWSYARGTNKHDLVQGTFPGMGAGHHVMGAIAAVTALHLLSAPVRWPLAIRVPIAALLFSLLLISDSKQVILALIAAGALVLARRVRGLSGAAALVARVFVLVAVTYAAMRALGIAQDFERLPLVLRAFAGKFAVFPLLVTHFDSPAGWIVGLGPGHGVSRLGGWLLDAYWDLLAPLGATRTTIEFAAWRGARPFGLESSLFAPLFSWAGIFGDVGLAGLAVYAALLSTVYRRFCRDDFARLVLLTIVLLGFFFEWLEEYNFMLFALAMIAERWREETHRAGPVAPGLAVRTRLT